MEVVIFLAFLFFWGNCDLYDHLTHDSCINKTEQPQQEEKNG